MKLLHLVGVVGCILALSLMSSVSHGADARPPQQVRVENGAREGRAHTDATQGTPKSMRRYSRKAHDKGLEKVEANAAARERAGLGRLFGTVIGGPLLGTAIGTGVGAVAGDDDHAESARRKTAETPPKIRARRSDRNPHPARSKD